METEETLGKFALVYNGGYWIATTRVRAYDSNAGVSFQIYANSNLTIRERPLFKSNSTYAEDFPKNQVRAIIYI